MENFKPPKSFLFILVTENPEYPPAWDLEIVFLFSTEIPACSSDSWTAIFLLIFLPAFAFLVSRLCYWCKRWECDGMGHEM